MVFVSLPRVPTMIARATSRHRPTDSRLSSKSPALHSEEETDQIELNLVEAQALQGVTDQIDREIIEAQLRRGTFFLS